MSEPNHRRALRRILIADDHPIVADAIAFTLRDLRLFDEIEIVRSLSEARARLDVDADYLLVMLDLNMPDSRGVEGIQVMREHYPDIPLVIFSGDDSVDTIRTAFESGVRGYITKDSTREVVVGGLKLVLAGDNYIPRHAMPSLGLESVPPPATEPTANRLEINLSPRQLQVMGYLLLGMPNKVIASRLGMAEGTVKTHLNTIYRVLGARNRVHAILRARELGLLEQAQHLLPENAAEARPWSRA